VTGVRPAGPADVPQLVQMIRELAAYERAPEQAVADEAALAEALFGARPAAFALVASAGGLPAGFAIWFVSFSTWLGRYGIYLEDLFVRPAFRGRGLGRALLGELGRIAVERGYGRLEWAVLDWNEPAIGFYRSLGAEPRAGWTTFRLTGEALRSLASGRQAQDPGAL
jgi:GNAT superfamily N-acetyltransferase